MSRSQIFSNSTFLVSQLARSQVTVSLSGDGGDELFGGYSRYFSMQSKIKKLRVLPPSIMRVFALSLRTLPPEKWNLLSGIAEKVAPNYFLKRNLGNLVYKMANAMDGVDNDSVYLQALSHWRREDNLQFGVKDIRVHYNHQFPSFTFERMMALDTLVTCRTIFVKLIATMAVSLEGRVPMLDHAWSNLPDSAVESMSRRCGKWPSGRCLGDIFLRYN